MIEKSLERLKILEKIENLERNGLFDQDAEDDPEAFELLPNKIDYLHKKLSTKILTALTIKKGEEFFAGQEKCGNLIIKDIVGRENLLDKMQGAIVTCNHINPFDNYIVYRALEPSLKKGRFYKVIKEGNYTNPPKGFEMFMRYGDTMPLSRNRQTMKKFLEALGVLLCKRHDKILVYPEQSMWWNYRKPKPLKNGAFSFAVTNGVPVQPLFITMEDTENIGGDGFPIQAYTIHILPAIFPDRELNNKENIEKMKAENYKFWVQTYESVYKTKLKYLTKEEK